MFSYLRKFIAGMFRKKVKPPPQPMAWQHLVRPTEMYSGKSPLKHIRKHGTPAQYNHAKRAAGAGNGREVRMIAAKVNVK